MAQKQLMSLFYPETHLYDNGSAGFYPAEQRMLKQSILVLDLKKTLDWLSTIFFTPSNIYPDTLHRADFFKRQFWSQPTVA